MFNDMYDTFNDVIFKYSFPFSFENRNQPYLEMIDRADDTWVSGVLFDLELDCDEELKDDEYLELSFYNFRYEKVVDIKSVIIVDNKARFEINSDVSEILLPDVYYYSLNIKKENEVVKELLQPNEKHFFYVKDKIC